MRVMTLIPRQYNHQLMQPGHVFDLESDHHFADAVYIDTLDKKTGKPILKKDGTPRQTLICKATMVEVDDNTPLGPAKQPGQSDTQQPPSKFNTAAEVFAEHERINKPNKSIPAQGLPLTEEDEQALKTPAAPKPPKAKEPETKVVPIVDTPAPPKRGNRG